MRRSFSILNVFTNPFRSIRVIAPLSSRFDFSYRRSVHASRNRRWARLCPPGNVPSCFPNVSVLQAIPHRQHRLVAERVLAKLEMHEQRPDLLVASEIILSARIWTDWEIIGLIAHTYGANAVASVPLVVTRLHGKASNGPRWKSQRPVGGRARVIIKADMNRYGVRGSENTIDQKRHDYR